MNFKEPPPQPKLGSVSLFFPKFQHGFGYLDWRRPRNQATVLLLEVVSCNQQECQIVRNRRGDCRVETHLLGSQKHVIDPPNWSSRRTTLGRKNLSGALYFRLLYCYCTGLAAWAQSPSSPWLPPRRCGTSGYCDLTRTAKRLTVLLSSAGKNTASSIRSRRHPQPLHHDCLDNVASVLNSTPRFIKFNSNH